MQEVFEKITDRLAEQHRKNRYESYNDEWNVGIDQAEQIVNEVAAEYNNGWIPCSERLPDESGSYLVTYREYSNGAYLPKYNNVCARSMRYRKDSVYNDWRYPICCEKEAEEDTNRMVIAWQPLPQPYELKEGEA